MSLLHISEERQGGAGGKKNQMEEETAAFPGLSNFEFFLVIYKDSWDKLRLLEQTLALARFLSQLCLDEELLDGREPRELKLREASGGRQLWDVEVVYDGDGHMYLGRGWDQFAHEYGLQPGHFLDFSYDGDAMLTVKVFDGTMCRRHYHYQQEDDAITTPAPRLQPVTIKDEDISISPGSESNSDGGSKKSIDTGGKNSSDSGRKINIDSGSNNSSSSAEKPEMDTDDALTSQFTVMLKQCNFGARQKQYLNVPVDFQDAHEYHKRNKVVLRMRDKSWPVTVKHATRANGQPRTSLRYGWHQFCVDNRLGVGDTCFFRALRGGDADCGEDHELKVEVRRRDGTFAD